MEYPVDIDSGLGKGWKCCKDSRTGLDWRHSRGTIQGVDQWLSTCDYSPWPHSIVANHIQGSGRVVWKAQDLFWGRRFNCRQVLLLSGKKPFSFFYLFLDGLLKWCCKLANIYITVTAGALWTSLAEIIDHPQQLLLILGDTLPKLAGYFISLLITKTLAGLPMVLLRIGALSRMMFLRSCFNKRRLTQRELNEVYRKQPILYGWEVRLPSMSHSSWLVKWSEYISPLFVAVPNTISRDYHLLHICMHYSNGSSSGWVVLFILTLCTVALIFLLISNNETDLSKHF